MADGKGTLKSETYDEGVFNRDCKIMELFIKNAETYTKLSAGALLLTVTFTREILGVKKESPLHPGLFLMVSWVCFLIAILSGAFYQYVAIKFLEWKSGVPRSHKNWLERLVRRPWPVYGVMLITFYLGCIFFTIFAVQNLRSSANGPNDPPQTSLDRPAYQTSLC